MAKVLEFNPGNKRSSSRGKSLKLTALNLIENPLIGAIPGWTAVRLGSRVLFKDVIASRDFINDAARKNFVLSLQNARQGNQRMQSPTEINFRQQKPLDKKILASFTSRQPRPLMPYSREHRNFLTSLKFGSDNPHPTVQRFGLHTQNFLKARAAALKFSSKNNRRAA